MEGITPIIMPKWGLSMREGKVVSWLVEEGTRITVGMPILEVETDKIANDVEAPDAGLLRRRIAKEGETLPVKALLGVLAEESVSEADIDAYVAAFVAPAAGDDSEDAASAYQEIEVDGIRVRYARKGSGGGTPVLFIHGFGGDLDNWLFNLEPVSEKAPAIALDLPGHGQSAIRLPGPGLVAMAAFVVHFLDAIDVPRAHLVGHSMGGAIAAQVALDFPDRVASITAIGTAGLGPEINMAYIDGFVQAESRRELKPVLELLFADPALVSRQMVDDMLKYKRLDGVGALLSSLASGMFPGGQQAALPLATLAGGLPVQLLWGHQDQVIPARHAGLAPAGMQSHVFEGAGHMLQLERAGDVNRLILALVAG